MDNNKIKGHLKNLWLGYPHRNIKNRCLAGVQHRIGVVLKSGQAVVKHRQGTRGFWTCPSLTVIYFHEPAELNACWLCASVAIMGADIVVGGRAFVVGGRAFVAGCQNPAGGKPLREEDRWARQPAMRCNVKRFDNLQQASQDVLLKTEIYIYLVQLWPFFLQSASFSGFTQSALVSLVFTTINPTEKKQITNSALLKHPDFCSPHVGTCSHHETKMISSVQSPSQPESHQIQGVHTAFPIHSSSGPMWSSC